MTGASSISGATVQEAADRIRPFVVRTPLERSVALSEACGLDVYLKFECFQATGSFKVRGAINALFQMAAYPAVVTASAGNHGLGVARAASILGMQATVVVPETASPAKVLALRSSGAELVLHGQTYDEAEVFGRGLAQSRGQPFLSPYNDPAVIAGGGTVALEILGDFPRARTLLVPTGGGGLISGVGTAAHGFDPEISVIGVQSEASPAMHAALASGSAVTVPILPSLADGLAGNVEPDSITLPLVRQHAKEILLVTEAEIAQAMRWLLEHEHVLVEGSAATGVAALLKRPPLEGPIAVVLTGRNVSYGMLQEHVLR